MTDSTSTSNAVMIKQFSTPDLVSISSATCQEVVECQERLCCLVEAIRADLASKLDENPSSNIDGSLKLVELLQENLGDFENIYHLQDAFGEFSRRFPEGESVQ